MSSYVRSALFVDFDNVFTNLGGLASPAARTFAADPKRWIHWMETAMGHVVSGAGEDTERRILLRNCYLNPERFGRFRTNFTRNAFRVVDCPPMTNQGKNSADIYMVLDIVDAIAHPTVFDEFILLSADADFTPIMTRLRAHDRRTILLASGYAASALVNACDLSLPKEVFVAEALGHPPEAADPIEESPPEPEPAPDLDLQRMRARMTEVLNEIMAGAPVPVPLATAAQRIEDAVPGAREAGWGAYRTFGRFVEAVSHPGLRICGPRQPGYIWDPERHHIAADGNYYPNDR